MWSEIWSLEKEKIVWRTAYDKFAELSFMNHQEQSWIFLFKENQKTSRFFIEEKKQLCNQIKKGQEEAKVKHRKWCKSRIFEKGKFTCLMCMDPMSPSASSNSTSRDSQKFVEPSFTWNAMFFPGYLQGVLLKRLANLRIIAFLQGKGEFFCCINVVVICEICRCLLWWLPSEDDRDLAAVAELSGLAVDGHAAEGGPAEVEVGAAGGAIPAGALIGDDDGGRATGADGGV